MKFTEQQILRMGKILVDTYNFTKDGVLEWLKTLIDSGHTYEDYETDKMVALIVG